MSERVLSETKLYIVVPCYNEEEIIEASASKLKEKLMRLISAAMPMPLLPLMPTFNRILRLWICFLINMPKDAM